ncbi:MAG: Flagellar sensor histidine kinase FleS [Nitrospira sp.]|nr:MAG: Flagellar sensor histidine kinase FleS [Nitrospira sp.]
MTGNPQEVRQAKSDMLARAFHDFDQAATVLQQSYDALTARLQEMDLELAQTNASLREHLRETEEMRAHVTAVLESLDTGVIVADSQDLVVRCNHSTERLLGIPQAQLRGRCAADILREIRKDHGEYPVMLPNGVVIALSQTDLTDEAGASIGKVVLIHDVTHIRRLEDRLQRRNRLEAMGQMVGCIAHEIRNPLGSVELFASLLRKDLGDRPPLRTYAEHISVAVQSMDRLLSNLLTYARPDCSKAGWQKTESLIDEVLTLASHAMSGIAIDVRRRLDPLVPRIWCDAAKMQQVLLNLVLNAVQAMPDGGALTIAVQAVPPHDSETPVLHIVVSDSGTGIAPDIRSRVFDPFFTTKDQGTGLGLAIVHALVEAHHGRIDVESSPGQGTSFVITLPQGPVRKGALPVPSAALAGRSMASFRMLSVTEEEIYE